MKTKKNLIPVVTMIFLITTTVIVTAIPFVQADTLVTRSYLAVNPNPAGINQEVLVSAWLQPIPPGSEGFDGL
ncbi:MAG: hypothetical protein NWF03_07120, partial [Candidatus Bathyarchaeota archaeon]|nr:hypothetical protein [Candidatus Bathyarchaeota archaeon]